MPTLADNLSYAVFTGFQFAALCVMTRNGRGWVCRAAALGVLVAVAIFGEVWWDSVQVPFDLGLAVCFVANWIAQTVLVFVLSHDSVGRNRGDTPPKVLSLSWFDANGD